MESSSVTSGWRGGVVSSLFDLFGNGGSVTSAHAVRVSGQIATSFEIPSTFLTRVDDVFSTT